MDEPKEDFLTPEERASLGLKKTNIYNIMGTASESGGRPTIITALCGYFFISWILKILNTIGILISLPANAAFSFNLTGFSLQGWIGVVLSVLYIISIFGYWSMKKWGVYLYIVLIVAIIIFGLFTIKTMGLPFVLSLFLPIVVILTGLKYLNIMS